MYRWMGPWSWCSIREKMMALYTIRAFGSCALSSGSRTLNRHRWLCIFSGSPALHPFCRNARVAAHTDASLFRLYGKRDHMWLITVKQVIRRSTFCVESRSRQAQACCASSSGTPASIRSRDAPSTPVRLMTSRSASLRYSTGSAEDSIRSPMKNGRRFPWHMRYSSRAAVSSTSFPPWAAIKATTPRRFSGLPVSHPKHCLSRKDFSSSCVQDDSRVHVRRASSRSLDRSPLAIMENATGSVAGSWLMRAQNSGALSCRPFTHASGALNIPFG